MQNPCLLLTRATQQWRNCFTFGFPELGLLRIRYRVASGGHNVPEADVRRRFGRTLRNLFML